LRLAALCPSVQKIFGPVAEMLSISDTGVTVDDNPRVALHLFVRPKSRTGFEANTKLPFYSPPCDQRSDPGVVRMSPVSSMVLMPERIIGQPPYSWALASSRS